jgi:iron complex outermembrane receptor protein
VLEHLLNKQIAHKHLQLTWLCGMSPAHAGAFVQESHAVSKKSNARTQSESSRHQHAHRTPFRPLSWATTVAALAATVCSPLQAAEPTVAELQAEIARLKQALGGNAATAAAESASAPSAASSVAELQAEIARLKQALAAQQAAAASAAAPASAPVPTPAPAPTIAELRAQIAHLQQALAAQQAAAPAAGTPPAVPAAPAVVPAAAAASEPAAPAVSDAAPAADPAQAAEPEPLEEVQELDKIVVRSRNRIERVQDVPLSVSVISGRELERELAADIGAITKRAANVVRNSGNSRTFSLSIRGVGKVSQTEAQDTSVGVILDGVNFAYAPLASFDFFDVESVEVARGPQGTLLGKNTTMGVINVTTRRPSFTPDANANLTFGQRHTLVSQFAIGGPVLDETLAWRGTLVLNKGAGAFANRYNPDQTYFDRDRAAGRAQFLWVPGADFNARVSVDMQPKAGEYYNGETVYTPVPATYINGGSTAGSAVDIQGKLARRWFADAGYSYQNDYLHHTEINADNQRPLITATNGVSAELKWNLGSHDLTSITAYRDYHFHARNDEGTPFDISKNGGGKVDAYRQQSQEIRLSSKPGGSVDYQAGALLFANTVQFGHGGWNAGWGSDAGAWFATNNQYSTLDADGNGRYLLTNSLNGVNRAQTQSVDNKSLGVFAQADWRLSGELTLTTGLRLTHEVRKNEGAQFLVSSGFAPELNSAALGGFDSVAWNNGAQTGGALMAGNSAAQLQLADYVANKYFGAAITATPGDAYNSLTAQQQAQVAAAKALRASQIGTLYPLTQSPTFRKTQPSFVVSPTYKLNPDQTTYVALQHGEKAGVSQLVNGRPLLAKPEKVTNLEWGLKSALWDKTLFVNADIFHTRVKDYQQAVTVPDPLDASQTINITGNAPKVRIQGVEVDGAYSGWRHTTVRFAGAYTDAVYKEFPNSPVPVEVRPGSQAFQDVSGQHLTGAARWTFNVGAEYRAPAFEDKLFHVSFNTAYTGKYNSDNNLSSYAWIDARWLTDAAIGLARKDQRFDLSLIVKNLFNDDTPQSVTWNSYVPADPRWLGVQLAARF